MGICTIWFSRSSGSQPLCGALPGCSVATAPGVSLTLQPTVLSSQPKPPERNCPAGPSLQLSGAALPLPTWNTILVGTAGHGGPRGEKTAPSSVADTKSHADMARA